MNLNTAKAGLLFLAAGLARAGAKANPSGEIINGDSSGYHPLTAGRKLLGSANYNMQEAPIGNFLLMGVLVAFAALAKYVLQDVFNPSADRVPVGGDLEDHPYNQPKSNQTIFGQKLRQRPAVSIQTVLISPPGKSI